MCFIGEFVKMRRVPKSKPIRAYRAWQSDTDGALRSTWYGRYEWKRFGVNHAHQTPVEGFYGLHAFRTSRGALEYAQPHNGEVTGSVYLWGIVAEHTDGYRAEHAKVCRLWRTK